MTATRGLPLSLGSFVHVQMARQKGLREQTEVILDSPAALNRGSQCHDMLRRIYVCYLTEQLLMWVEAKLASSGCGALALSPLLTGEGFRYRQVL